MQERAVGRITREDVVHLIGEVAGGRDADIGTIDLKGEVGGYVGRGEDACRRSFIGHLHGLWLYGFGVIDHAVDVSHGVCATHDGERCAAIGVGHFSRRRCGHTDSHCSLADMQRLR